MQIKKSVQIKSRYFKLLKNLSLGFLLLFQISSVFSEKTDSSDDIFKMDEVLVSPEIEDSFDNSFKGINISGESLRRIPQNFFADISTGLATFPGVVKYERFSGEIYVRGGKPYELLHILNGVPLFNPYKWGDAMMLYHQEIVNDAELYPGGFSARYPQANSGVLEVNYKEGNKERYSGECKLGAETAFLFEGPIAKGSFILSYRRTFYDIFLNEDTDDGEKMEYPAFEDFYFNISQSISEKDKISFWGYNSTEWTELIFSELESEEDWENEEFFTDDDKINYSSRATILTADWKHFFSNEIMTKLVYSKNWNDLKNYDLNTFLQDIEFNEKTEFDTFLAEYHHRMTRHFLRLGYAWVSMDTSEFDSTISFFIPDQESERMLKKEYLKDLDSLKNEGAIYQGTIKYGYLEDQITLGKFTLTPGINHSYSNLVTNNRHITDLRFKTSFQWSPSTLLKASIGQYSMQGLSFFHREQSPDLKPEKSIHYIVGIEKQFEDRFLSRIEVYYKDLTNRIIFDPNEENEKQEGEYRYIYDNRGEGYSKGMEFFLQAKKKTNSKWDGWISYSYCKTQYKDDSITHPEEYYPIHDQRHTLNIIGNYYFINNNRHECFLSGYFSWHSGRRYENFEIMAIPLKDKTVYVKKETDQYEKLPDYLNLDLTLEYVRKFKKLSLHSYFQLLNATDHKNVISYYVPTFKNRKGEYTEMGITPTAGVKIRF